MSFASSSRKSPERCGLHNSLKIYSGGLGLLAGDYLKEASDYNTKLVGVGLFLSHLAHLNISCKALRDSYPSYFMSKNKIQLTPQIDVDGILSAMATTYKNEDISTIDGVKIDFENEWVHLRKSNTEPIIRIYTESNSQANADALAERIIEEIKIIAKI